MNIRNTPTTSTSEFNLLPTEARSLFIIFVMMSLAFNGHSDIPRGKDLRRLAGQAFEDLGIDEAMLSDPNRLSKLLDAYFRKSSAIN